MGLRQLLYGGADSSFRFAIYIVRAFLFCTRLTATCLTAAFFGIRRNGEGARKMGGRWAEGATESDGSPFAIYVRFLIDPQISPLINYPSEFYLYDTDQIKAIVLFSLFSTRNLTAASKKHRPFTRTLATTNKMGTMERLERVIDVAHSCFVQGKYCRSGPAWRTPLVVFGGLLVRAVHVYE